MLDCVRCAARKMCILHNFTFPEKNLLVSTSNWCEKQYYIVQLLEIWQERLKLFLSYCDFMTQNMCINHNFSCIFKHNSQHDNNNLLKLRLYPQEQRSDIG